MQKSMLLLLFFLQTCLLRAQDPVIPPSPHSSLSVRGDTLSMEGRTVELDPQGFPGQIKSFFSSGGIDTGAVASNILAENIHFHFTRLSDGKDIKLQSEGVTITLQQSTLVEWRAGNVSDELKMELSGSLRSDGSLSYKVKLTALQDLELKEITMHIPFEKKVAKKINGVGLGEDYEMGGMLFPRDSTFSWKADSSHAEEADIWVGTTNAGLRYSLNGPEWRNEGRGGVTLGIKGKSFLANNYSGAHSMKKGEELHYDFDLRITPFKTIR